MKCVECQFYITAEQTGDQPGCCQDGDVTNPNEDINCVAGGDEELGRAMKKIIIIGTRRRNTHSDFVKVELTFLKIYNKGDMIVSGGCPKGGDRFAEILIKKYNTPKKIFRAKWRRHGRYDKYAGFKRNTLVARFGDEVIACVASDRTGGTEDTIKKFKKFHPNGEIHLC